MQLETSGKVSGNPKEKELTGLILSLDSLMSNTAKTGNVIKNE